MKNTSKPTKMSEIINKVALELGVPKEAVSDVSSFYFKDLIKQEIAESETTLSIMLEGLGSFDFYKRRKEDEGRAERTNKMLDEIRADIKQYKDLVNSKTLDNKAQKRAQTTLYSLEKKYQKQIKRLKNYSSLSKELDAYEEKVKEFKTNKHKTNEYK